jgi:hypothetical protein
VSERASGDFAIPFRDAVAKSWWLMLVVVAVDGVLWTLELLMVAQAGF